MALSFIGGAYLFGEAMERGLENYGVQYDKVTTAEIDEAQIEELNADSKQLTRTSVTYLAGSVALLGTGAWMALKLNDETIAYGQAELTGELLESIESMQHATNNLLNSNRTIRSGINEYDLHHAEFEADHQVKV